MVERFLEHDALLLDTPYLQRIREEGRGENALAGRLYDRLDLRVVAPMGGLHLGAGLALTSQIQALWYYDLHFEILGAVGIVFITTPAAAIMRRWFSNMKGNEALSPHQGCRHMQRGGHTRLRGHDRAVLPGP